MIRARTRCPWCLRLPDPGGEREWACRKPKAAPVILKRCDAVAGRRLPAAHLAGVSGSVAAGPRRALVPWGRVAAAEGCLEARAFLVAEQRAPKVMDPIDRSFWGFLGLSNSPFVASILRGRKCRPALDLAPCPNRSVRPVPALALISAAGQAGFQRGATVGAAAQWHSAPCSSSRSR